jgi:hypothetical protein
MPEDQFDAMAVYEAFVVYQRRREPYAAVLVPALERVFSLHDTLRSNGHLTRQMRDLELTTFAERVRYGATLLTVEYRER